MKTLLLFFVSASAFAAQPVTVVSEQVIPFVLSGACHPARAVEPKFDVTYRVHRPAADVSITRPIYSDLCALPTQQFTGKIFSRLDANDRSPVLGIAGTNEDRAEYGVATFSQFAVK